MTDQSRNLFLGDDPNAEWEPGTDPRLRPPDPAGTRPRVDPKSLLPTRRGPLLGSDGHVEGEVVEDRVEELDEHLGFVVSDDEERLPDRVLPARPEAYTQDGPDVAPSRFAARFQFLTGALIACGLAAIVAVVVLAVGSGSSDSTSAPKAGWSAWAPTTSSIAKGASQIAGHVAPQYKLANGSQMLAVTGGALSYGAIPLSIAVRAPASAGGGIQLVSGNGALYRMCGLGPNCSIPGKPTVERGLLMRRQALELALYSFHYLDDLQNVVVFLAPQLGQTPVSALWFTRASLKAELAQPLSQTLAPTTPTEKTMDASPDAATVSAVTGPSIFGFTLTAGNTDDHGYIVIQPLADALAAQKAAATAAAAAGSSGSSSGATTP